ncbi:M16 family metallopeptidase [Streptomyces sp. NPDC059176]|uniref:M16 family metallopeptidase n=1 Tax=unclassified Streptomyces TaxID=2593676 RepID=UPI0036B44DBD
MTDGITETETDGIVETETDGIRTVLAARSGGQVAAGLFFRVGSADETLSTTGVTHLVEHLALHRHGLSDLHYNGATTADYTHFHVEGTVPEVVEYLNGVCAALRDLPMERLETEKEILRTEASGRSQGPVGQLPLWRYGARGYGLLSYAELGLPRLDAATVTEWARTRFTRENAVLWVTSGTLPEGLDLRLPSGPRHPAPTVTSALPQTPAYFRGDDGVVALSAVVRRSSAASLFAEVLGRGLFLDLRQKGGYSYRAHADYAPRDAEHATVTAVADALPEKQDAVVGGFVDVLARLRLGRIDGADLEAARNTLLTSFDTPDLDAAKLPSYALNLLTGHRNQSVAEAVAELNAVTVEDLRAVAREVWDSALMQVPERGLDWAGFAAAPAHSADVVSGRAYRCLDDDSVELVVAADGVSLKGPSARVTVRFAECAAMLVYPDGARRLTGNDGFSLMIEPTLYKLDQAALATVDAGVAPAAVVGMPPRDPSRIPRPRSKAERKREKAARTRSPKRQVAAWTFGVLAALWGLVTLVGTSDEFGAAAGPDWGALAALWVVQAALVVPAVQWARTPR